MTGNSNSGRKPKATRELILSGAFRHDRHGHRSDQVVGGKPTCPRWLKGEAKKLWTRLLKSLGKYQAITELDGEMLAAFCRWYFVWRQLDEEYNEEPTSARLRMAALAFEKASSLGSRFGLTPADRTRLHFAPTQKKDSNPAARYFDTGS